MMVLAGVLIYVTAVSLAASLSDDTDSQVSADDVILAIIIIM